MRSLLLQYIYSVFHSFCLQIMGSPLLLFLFTFLFMQLRWTHLLPYLLSLISIRNRVIEMRLRYLFHMSTHTLWPQMLPLQYAFSRVIHKVMPKYYCMDWILSTGSLNRDDFLEITSMHTEQSQIETQMDWSEFFWVLLHLQSNWGQCEEQNKRLSPTHQIIVLPTKCG